MKFTPSKCSFGFREVDWTSRAVLFGSADGYVLFGKLRRFCSALHALINYLVSDECPNIIHSSKRRLD
jgi:hypothetical protein